MQPLIMNISKIIGDIIIAKIIKNSINWQILIFLLKMINKYKLVKLKDKW
jgi:hypothetical protein